MTTKHNPEKEINSYPEISELGLMVVDHVEAMLAYWDKSLVCRFANNAYIRWFGKTREEMIGKITIKELLGPLLYEKNLPYINGALAGKQQVFEREIQIPSGETLYSLANYYPNIINGEVQGFFVQVSDITLIKKLEFEQKMLNSELKTALNEVKKLSGLLPICAWCKKILDDNGYWTQLETYISQHSEVDFSHGICIECATELSKHETIG